MATESDMTGIYQCDMHRVWKKEATFFSA